MSFDTLAPHYTWMERLLAGPRLQRARTAWLPALALHRDVLIAGVGHGHFLAQAARTYPHLHFTCLDASAGMLRAAEKRLHRRVPAARDRVTFLQTELPHSCSTPAPASFDVIVTPFFLDCFPPEDLRAVIATLAASARESAAWLVADFAIPPRGLARQRARATHALMYAFFRRVTGIHARHLTEPDTLLRAQGFTLAGRRTFEWGLLRSDLWQREPSEEVYRT